MSRDRSRKKEARKDVPQHTFESLTGKKVSKKTATRCIPAITSLLDLLSHATSVSAQSEGEAVCKDDCLLVVRFPKHIWDSKIETGTYGQIANLRKALKRILR